MPPRLWPSIRQRPDVLGQDSAVEKQVVRLIVGSANLTTQGYRSNIELAAAVDDAPGASPEACTRGTGRHPA